MKNLAMKKKMSVKRCGGSQPDAATAVMDLQTGHVSLMTAGRAVR
jgi:hypothetical protein